MSETTQRSAGQRRRYPSLNLEQAVDRTRVLYDAERLNAAPIDVVVRHWGFKSSKTGPASTAFSAVKQFGLIEEAGTAAQRKAAVSKLGRGILTAPADVRVQMIRTAALEPPMNRLVWDKYGADTGSLDAFKWYLISELGFSDTGAGEFAKQYAATIAFAGLDNASADAVEPPETKESVLGSPGRAADEFPSQGPADSPALFTFSKPAPPRQSSSTSRHAIPLIGGKQVVLEGEFPLTEAAWAGFMAVLEAFKPGLVQADVSPLATPSSSPDTSPATPSTGLY